MRTKTLLIAAAALAAGVISSQAQPVYSQNIVGYVNQPIGINYTTLSQPLDLAVGNNLTNIFPNVYNATAGQGPLDSDQVFIWNGHGYTVLTLDSTLSTGVGDAQDIDGIAQPSPFINPGTLFYFNNVYTKGFTNTIVGTVHVDVAATGSQTVGTATNNLAPGYTFVASKIPVSGGVQSVLGFTNIYNATAGQGPLDSDQIYLPKVSPTTGAFLGYTVVTFDSTLSTGFGDAQDIDGIAQPEPVISLGNGFIFNNVYATPTTWVQSF
jgi:hypothetical protein